MYFFPILVAWALRLFHLSVFCYIIMKRFLLSYTSTLLATATLLFALPGQNLLAQASHPFDQADSGTDGTSDAPYKISTIEHLNAIRGEYLDDHFMLTTDLDFSEYTYEDSEKGWLPIGHATNTAAITILYEGPRFTGSFDGNDHVIRNLRIDRGGEDYVGLFGYVDGGSIVSLGLEDLEMTGDEHVGGLVGLMNAGTVTGSYATGRVTGGQRVGGLVGSMNAGTVTGSYATGSVTGKFNVGGLVGWNNATVSSSYATGSVTGKFNVGGLVGWNNATVSSSYATGSVTGNFRVGGLVGHNYEGPVSGGTNSATLVELTEGTVTQSYWNTQLSGNADSSGGVGLTTAAMFDKASFAGFDFTGTAASEGNPEVLSVWKLPVLGVSFPHLRGTSKNGQILSVPRVGVMPGSAPFPLEYTLLPPTISEQAPAFSGDDDAVATINASTGIITLAAGVTGGAVTITVQRDGNEDYAPISVSQTLVVSPFGGGTGISADPWQIRTPAHLNAIRGEFLNDHFMLTTDLDFLGYTYDDLAEGWLPIGHDTDASSNGYQGTRFTGSFDGNDHVIRNLRIDRGGENYVGLFGYVSDGSIVSLGLEDLEVTGNFRVGGLVGWNNDTVTGSYATGSVTGELTVGGLVGWNGGGTVTGSYATGSVTGNGWVGGLAGGNNGTVTDSYATGNVTGASNVGGLVGHNRGTVTGSYATGSVTTGSGGVGGLVGENNSGTVTDSYWNTQLSGNATSSGGVGLTTAQMYDQDSFVGFDFAGTPPSGGNPEVLSVWLPPRDDERFPHLRGVSKNGQVLSVPRVEMIPESVPFLLEHTLLPPTIFGQTPAFSGDDDAVATIDASGMITLAAEVTIGDEMTITVRRGGNDDYAPISVSQTLVVIPFVGGTGTSMNPWQIRTPARLNAIRGEYLDDHFILTTDLDFSEYTYEDPEKGWLPIGHDTDTGSTFHQGRWFTGSFDGNGHVIRNLRIDREGEDYVGLFGRVGRGASIVSLGLEDLEVTGNQRVGGLVGEMDSTSTVTGSYATGSVEGEYAVGGLAGLSFGPVTDSYATGSVRGDQRVGGLVGYSDGTVMGSYATGSVTGDDNVGGLVGFMGHLGTVMGSYATGSVTGDDNVGGLVGLDFAGAVTGSYATGSVTGESSVGGLIGESYAAVTGSYATGSVTGDQRVGGLAGLMGKRGTVSSSYATGAVTGSGFSVGGLVGENNDGTVRSSYATGSVTGDQRVGGLVGWNNDTVTGSYATGSVTGDRRVGGLVGWNNDTVTHSYATGSVTGGSNVGGLVGENEDPMTGGSNVGGLVEFTGGTVTQSYWNTQLSGNADSDGGVGLTTAEMFIQGSFAGFDFDGTTDSGDNEVASVWLPPVSGQHFPHLRGVSKNGQILSVPRVVVMPGSAPFPLEYTLLPPTISEQTPAFSGDDDAVATIDASTGNITLAVGVTGGAVTITVQRDGNEDYAPISVSQTLVVSPFGGGTGASTNPLQISTLTHLNAIRGEYLDDHFLLTTDLDFSGYTYEDPEKGWLPIGHDSDASSDGYQGTRFTGSFDGNGYVIRNLRVDRGGEDYVGLFGGVGSGGSIVFFGSGEFGGDGGPAGRRPRGV